jgi:hypothetical protein
MDLARVYKAEVNLWKLRYAKEERQLEVKNYLRCIHVPVPTFHSHPINSNKSVDLKSPFFNDHLIN